MAFFLHVVPCRAVHKSNFRGPHRLISTQVLGRLRRPLARHALRGNQPVRRVHVISRRWRGRPSRRSDRDTTSCLKFDFHTGLKYQLGV